MTYTDYKGQLYNPKQFLLGSRRGLMYRNVDGRL